MLDSPLGALLRQLYDSVLSCLRSLDVGTLRATGVLGLALAVIGYLQYRGSNRDSNARARNSPSHVTTSNTFSALPGSASTSTPTVATSSAVAVDAADAAPSKPSARAQKPVRVEMSPLAQSVNSALAGVKRISISVPGVLFNETEVLHSASVVDAVAALMAEICQKRDVYLISQVADDIGQAVAAGTLEASGMIGTNPGQIVSHRLLFCSTLEGKVSIVRQLEPDLHIDGHEATVDVLKRFVSQLWLVKMGASAAQPSASPNVARGASLASFFDL